MSKIFSINEEGFTLNLKPGMAWALYSDNGPGGPCGQSMNITCPHSVFMTWPNEEKMREALKNGIGRNKNAKVLWGVVGDYSTGGIFRVEVND